MKQTTISLVEASPPRIEIRTDFAFKEICKAIPAARWSPVSKCWYYPATPTIAKAIVESFQDADVTALHSLLLLSERTPTETAEITDSLRELLTAHELWDHQIRAVGFALPRSSAMLAMEMGTGKSRVAVELVELKKLKKVLIVCPVSVIRSWVNQFSLYATLPTKVIPLSVKSSVRQRCYQAAVDMNTALARKHTAVVIVNYEAAYREEFVDWCERAGFEAVVLDESHRIKSPSGITAKTIYKLGASIPYRLCLTGTMMPNSPLDVFSQFRFLDVGIFGSSFVKFRTRYAVMGGYGMHQVKAYQNMAEMTEKIASNSFEAGKELLDLPPEMDVTRTCTLEGEAKRVYEALESEFVADFEGGRILAAHVLTRLIRLQQTVSGFSKLDGQDDVVEIGNDKQKLLADVIDDLPKEEKLVIFCHFIHDLASIRKVLEDTGRKVGEISGRVKNLTPSAKFPPEFDALVVQQQSGGLGIDLTEARYAIHFNLGYSLGDYLQGKARVHRPGQTRPVTHIHLVAEGTIDEKIIKALASRREVVQSVLEQIKERK